MIFIFIILSLNCLGSLILSVHCFIKGSKDPAFTSKKLTTFEKVLSIIVASTTVFLIFFYIFTFMVV